MKWERARRGVLAVLAALLVTGGIAFYLAGITLSYLPGENDVVPHGPGPRAEVGTYDYLGKTMTGAEIAALQRFSPPGPSPDEAAVKITPELLQLGRRVFYLETFGNEVFTTDIAGILAGPLSPSVWAKAILSLGGKGTSNLKLTLPEEVTIGGKTFPAGSVVATGVDVAKGRYLPIGMPIKISRGRIRAGITCALCHATVEPKTGKVIEGAPNADLNVGLLLAMSKNSTAYFTHTGVRPAAVKSGLRTVDQRAGGSVRLPEAEAMEDAVDNDFLAWPPGNFDSTIDIVNNPAQIPDSFTFGDWPYSWNGFAAVGPFHGLAAFSNNVHAQNADTLSQSEVSDELFGIDPEVYLGVILQNAPSKRYRLREGERPGRFFQQVDPNPEAPGVNQLVTSPTFPNPNPAVPDGLIAASPGSDVGEEINAVAAWQNRVTPPRYKPNGDEGDFRGSARRGARLFRQAGCASCHSGVAFSSNTLISAERVGTEPSRAKSFKAYASLLALPKLYVNGTPAPLPEDPNAYTLPTGDIDPKLLEWPFNIGNPAGAYKTKGLIGLNVSAPYLHDGGVAAGADAVTWTADGWETGNLSQLGLAGTLLQGVVPDSPNSLLVLIDRELRARAVRANRESTRLQVTHVTGEGHPYWVDGSAGYSRRDQRDLVNFLLSPSGSIGNP